MKIQLLLSVSFLALLQALAAHPAMAESAESQPAEAPVGAPNVPVNPTPVLSDDDFKFKASTGASYISGKFNQPSTTDILYAPFTGEVSKGPWTFNVTVPWVTIHGNGAVIGAGDVGVVAPGLGSTETHTGLGDVETGLTYTWKFPEDTAALGFTGQVKFPTGDRDKSLGTGEFDFTGLVNVAKRFDKVVLFGVGGHRFSTNNQNFNNFDLKGIWQADVGAAYSFSDKWMGGLIYDWRQSATDATDNPSQLTPFVNYNITPQTNIQAYGVAGLSNGSPDLGAGLTLGYKFQ
jgi:hypothetical protein